MGEGQLRDQPRSFTEIFEETFPAFLAMGMSYEQFWEGEPSLVRSYLKAEKIRRRQMNEQLWLSGIYMAEALSSTVGNMFSKGNPHKYPSEPLPITEEEVLERKERESKARMEKIKAAFTAKALSVNARMRGENNDR